MPMVYLLCWRSKHAVTGDKWVNDGVCRHGVGSGGYRFCCPVTKLFAEWSGQQNWGNR
jgi:hypothetical protein